MRKANVTLFHMEPGSTLEDVRKEIDNLIETEQSTLEKQVAALMQIVFLQQMIIEGRVKNSS